MAETDNNINHESTGKGSTGAGGHGVQLVIPAINGYRDLANDLVEKVVSTTNLKSAFKAVKRNKGAPGIDKQTISQVEVKLGAIIEELQATIPKGQYKPLPVREATIPKGNGKTRLLGIPTVIDRMVQQALVQILSPIIDPHFSDSSFGFRPKKSAVQAVSLAKKFVQDERKWVVDIDIEAFFDNVNHDILMSRLAQYIADKKILKLVRKYLQAGMMRNGVCIKKEQGTPQGGPLSPLLSNIMLHDLDLELSRRRLKFVRYADDCVPRARRR